MLRRKAVPAAAITAAALALGGLVGAPAASAKPMSCSQALKLHSIYMTTGDIFFALGDTSTAAAYYGRASGVVEAAC